MYTVFNLAIGEAVSPLITPKDFHKLPNKSDGTLTFVQPSRQST